MKVDFSIKKNQKKYILNLIREREPITRSRVREITGIRLGTIGKVIEELKKENLIIEYFIPGKSRGRKKGWLKINSDGRYVIGIELSPDFISAVIMNLKGKVLEEEKEVLAKNLAREKIIEKILSILEKIVKNHRNNLIDGIGFVDPGVIDSKRGISLHSSILPEWRNVKIKEIIEKKFEYPVYLVNTSSAKVLAEKVFEYPNKIKNLVYVEYGKGLSCGIYADGNLITGHREISGEFGHIKIPGERRKCKCGKKGCLEALVSFPEIKKDVKYSLKKSLKIEEIFERYERGDKEIDRIIEKKVYCLSLGVSYILNILNPHLLVLDHNFKNICGKRFIKKFVNYLEKFTLREIFDGVKVKISNLGDNIGALGGGATVIEKIFDC